MSTWKGMRARLASLRRGATDARMEEEFAFHVAMEVERNLRLGMSPAEARRRARLAFGGEERHREGMRDGRALRWATELGRDLRFSLRGLARTPVFTVVGVVTIGLGVGATTALFSLANSVLLRRLPIPGAERVVAIQEYRRGMVSNGVEGERIPLERYRAYREATGGLFAGLAAHRTHAVSLRTRGDAHTAHAVLTAGPYFDALGIRPALGRYPAEGDRNLVVVSHALWQRSFGGATDVIGSDAWVDGRAYTITAVAPVQFRGTVWGLPVDVWVPLDGYAEASPRGFDLWVTPFGRLRPGVTREAALTEVGAAGRRIPDPDATIRHVALEPLGGLTGEGRSIAKQFLVLQVGAALLVLLIAASNIAGMLLARALARQREMAVRLAIGAGRWKLVRQLLTESVVLFTLGGVLGVLLAFWLTGLLSRVQAPAPGMALHLSATPDGRVLLFALAITVVPALLFGLAPALQATRRDVVGGCGKAHLAAECAACACEAFSSPDSLPWPCCSWSVPACSPAASSTGSGPRSASSRTASSSLAPTLRHTATMRRAGAPFSRS